LIYYEFKEIESSEVENEYDKLTEEFALVDQLLSMRCNATSRVAMLDAIFCEEKVKR